MISFSPITYLFSFSKFCEKLYKIDIFEEKSKNTSHKNVNTEIKRRIFSILKNRESITERSVPTLKIFPNEQNL